MNPLMNWVPVMLVCWVLACFVFVVWFCVLFGFVLCVFAVCLVYDDDGPMDYVQVLPQFSFAALNSRWPGTLICNYCLCNVIQCGKRPGESHEGVGRKKRDLSDLARFHKSEQVSQKYFLSIMQENWRKQRMWNDRLLV